MPSEDCFTPPSEFCPNPHWWHADDAQSTEEETLALVGGFVRALQPEFVLETGTAFGAGAEVIGHALIANGHGHLVSLEVEPALATLARERVEGLPVTVLAQSSLSYTPPPDTVIDFAWFDSLTWIRAEEFRRFQPRIRHGAIVGFHDTGPQHPTRSYLEPLESEGLIRPVYLHTPRGVCFAEVLRGQR